MVQGWQEALAALLVDARVRAQWKDAPDDALARFALDVRERAMLAALPHAEIDRQAAMYAAKRWGEVARAVPLTLRVCPTLAARYLRWLETHPPQAHDDVLDPGVAEGLRALDALRAEIADDEGEASYAGDLLAYELLAAASRQDGRARRLTSRFALPAIVRDIAAEMLPADPDREEAHEVRFEGRAVGWRRR